MTPKQLIDKARLGTHQPLGDAEPTELVNLRMTVSEVREINKFSRSVRELTGVFLSRSYILREGGRLLRSHIRKMLNKAKRGALHAKKRNEIEIEVEAEETQPLRLRRSRGQRRRRVVGRD